MITPFDADKWMVFSMSFVMNGEPNFQLNNQDTCVLFEISLPTYVSSSGGSLVCALKGSDNMDSYGVHVGLNGLKSLKVCGNSGGPLIIDRDERIHLTVKILGFKVGIRPSLWLLVSISLRLWGYGTRWQAGAKAVSSTVVMFSIRNIIKRAVIVKYIQLLQNGRLKLD